MRSKLLRKPGNAERQGRFRNYCRVFTASSPMGLSTPAPLAPSQVPKMASFLAAADKAQVATHTLHLAGLD